MTPLLSDRRATPAPARAPASPAVLATTLLAAASISAQAPVDANHAAAAAVGATVAPGTRGQGPHTQGAFAAGVDLSWDDDFDRPDSTNMGPDWTEYSGDQAIVSNHGQGNLNSGWSYMLHNSAAMAPASTRMEIDLLPPTGTSGPHVALIAGATAGATQWLYTKIQDNDGDGLYDRIYFYSNGNGGSWGSNPLPPLIVPVATGRVYMYFTNAGDTLNVAIDSDFDGIVDQSYANQGALAVPVAGNEFGIGAWAMGSYDNWRVTDGVAASAQTYGSGCPGSGGIVPAIGATGLPQIGNAGFAITVQNGLSTSIGVVIAGSAATNVPIGACTVLVAPPWASQVVPLDGSGAGAALLPVPNNQTLAGVMLFAQYLVIDASGSFLGFSSLSDGLSIVVGN